PAEDVAAVVWRHPLPEAGPRVATSLAYHPMWEGGTVFVSSHREIHGFQLADGAPAWRDAPRAVFREQLEGVMDRGPVPADTLGGAQFTLTAHNRRLLGRLGSSVTAEPLEPDASLRASYLVCLDLRAEGRLLWQIPSEEGWAFEGTAVSDGANVYVGMRRSDVRPQAHLASFDAETGRRRWQRFICAADTPARGLMSQASHNLVTLVGDTLYYNTNLGAVAAVSVDEGRVRWLSLYPRARSGDSLNLAPHWRREANPCVYHRGMLLVAPSDGPRVFALDAATGQMLWQSGPETEGILHLLGTTDRHLIAAGDRLYWILLDGPKGGRVEHVWPDGSDQPGFGRGVLAGPHVLWPTRGAIHVFDRQTAKPVRVIDLVSLRAAGGNLLVAGDRLVIATPTELIALGAQPGPPRAAGPPPIASRLQDAGRPVSH
ncbi:MAG: PQQ-binding-like beta-propeller repeat protein, partial [Patescibacteria group bacterium]|nr:PQQ-binding-like beta-propeller repeat protein [Patescibacteria group bacterium]